MGLYLCVFAGPAGGSDEELDGVEVGSYADFGAFREAVAGRLEPGGWGSRFPLLMGHDDADGEWSAGQAGELAEELRAIRAGFEALPPDGFGAPWQARLARDLGWQPASLAGCFLDVDGEPLLDRLIELAETAARAARPISFQ
jgi:hypothetical protein